MESNPLDLRAKINKAVLDNQGRPSGNAILSEVNGCLHLYHHDEDLFIGERFSRRLHAEQGWFEKLVAHAPTVGTFYEDALRELVREVLPGQLKIGTGFIFDTDRRCHSRQLDILVYNDSQEAPLYRRGQFVVIPPKLAVAQSEVKKTLTLADVRTIIRTSANSYFGDHPADPPGCHRLNIFSYSSRSKTDRIFDVVVETLAKHILSFRSETISGKDVRLGVYSFVLPQFFFFDRDSCIETRLRAQEDGLFFDCIVSEVKASLNDGLNEYLYQMTASHRPRRRFDERDFRTYPLQNIEREITVAPSVYLVKKVPMLDLIERFPTDAQKIRSFRVNGRRPHNVWMPAGRDLSTVESFDDLTKIAGVSWWTEEL